MLFVDMICVQWRHAGKKGRIVVRGTNNVLLFECTLVPQPSGPRKGPKHTSASTMSHDATDNSGVCCYHHTQSCRGDLHHHGKNSGQKPRGTSYAVSVGLDVKEHPIVTILYQERFSEQEHSVGTVDVEYNKLLFKRGFFADSVMQAQGYGVLFLCHNLQETPDGLTRRAFVTSEPWRSRPPRPSLQLWTHKTTKRARRKSRCRTSVLVARAVIDSGISVSISL